MDKNRPFLKTGTRLPNMAIEYAFSDPKNFQNFWLDLLIFVHFNFSNAMDVIFLSR